MGFKVNPIAKPDGSRREMKMKTQMSPSLKDKIAAANAAPPPPSGGAAPSAEGGAPPAVAGAPGADAGLVSTQKTIVEGSVPGSEAKAPEANPQLAALARKERQVRKAQEDLKAREDAFKAREADYVPKARLTSETRAVLSELGITYDKLTEQELGEDAQDPQAALLQKISELEAKLDAQVTERKTSEQQRDTDARASAVNQIRADAKFVVDSDPAFETIKATDSVSDVVELIEKTFDKSGEMLSVEEACRLVEDVLVERETERIRKLSNLPKIKSKLAPADEGNLPQSGTKPLTRQPPKTLTNSHAVTRPLSARERAIQAFDRARTK
jgi:hypothetical protein